MKSVTSDLLRAHKVRGKPPGCFRASGRFSVGQADLIWALFIYFVYTAEATAFALSFPHFCHVERERCAETSLIKTEQSPSLQLALPKVSKGLG